MEIKEINQQIIANVATVENFSIEDSLQTQDVINRAFATFLIKRGITIKILNEPRPGVSYVEKALIPENISLVIKDKYGVIGSIFTSVWGKFAVLGPLAVDPNKQGLGISSKLMGKTMDILKEKGIKKVGLYTFPGSELHESLYIKKFNFVKKNLNPIFEKSVTVKTIPDKYLVKKYSTMSNYERDEYMGKINKLTERLDVNFSLSNEITSTKNSTYSESIFLLNKDNKDVYGFAVCHFGKGSEAGNDKLHVKFGMGNPEIDNSEDNLLIACENFASEKGMSRINIGISENNVKILNRNGFHDVIVTGVIMIKNLDGTGDTEFNNDNVPAFYDWR